MGLTLEVMVDGARSEALSTRWRTLAVTDGVGYESDRAVLVVSVGSPEVIELPRLGSEISFVASRDGRAGEEIGGALRTSSVSGDSRGGSVTVEMGAVAPESALREQRTVSWSGKTFAEILGAIAGRSALVPAVPADLAGVVPAGAIQEGESDRMFLHRLLQPFGRRVVIKEGRLAAIKTGEQVSVSGAGLAATRVDLRGDAWYRWRRADSGVRGTFVAQHYGADGVTIETAMVGSGIPVRTLQGVYPMRGAAVAAAERKRQTADASRDWLEIETSLTPGARALHPLEVVGQPVGFPSRLTLHEVHHTLGGKVAMTRLRARP